MNKLDVNKSWKEIVSAGKKGFEDLFLSCYPFFFVTGYRLSGDKDFTKDIIQVFFLELYEKQDQIKNVDNINAYLSTSFRRKVINEIQKKDKRRKHLSVNSNQNSSPSYETLLIKSQKEEEQKFMLENALDGLPVVQKEMIKMRFLQELSYKEIAEITGKSPQTIYNQIHTAISKLKKGLLALIC